MANPGAPLTPLQTRLYGFILQELDFTPARPLEPDTPLFEALLDSTSVLALVAHLEQQFQLLIEDQELVPGNFATLRQLADFVERKARPAPSQRAAKVA